jgi:PAS domain-containing protein
MTTDQSREQLSREIKALQGKIIALKKKELAYKQIIENMNEMIHPDADSNGFIDNAVYVIFDRKYEFINHTFSEMFHVMPEEICNNGFNPMTLIALESRRLVLDKYREGLNCESNAQQFFFKALTRDGLKIDCKTHAFFIPYKWGVAMQGTVWNLSALNRFDNRVISWPQQRRHTIAQNSSLFSTKKASRLNVLKESAKETGRESLKTAYGSQRANAMI